MAKPPNQQDQIKALEAEVARLEAEKAALLEQVKVADAKVENLTAKNIELEGDLAASQSALTNCEEALGGKPPPVVVVPEPSTLEVVVDQAGALYTGTVTLEARDV